MKLFKNVVIYGVSNAVASGVSYFLVLFLTLFITPDGIGQITNFQYLGSLLLPLIGFSSVASINREYFEDKVDFNELIWQVVYLVGGSVLLLLVIGLFVGDVVSSYTALSIKFVALALLFAFFFQIVEYRLTIFRLKDQAKSFGLWKIVKAFIEIAVTVCGVYWISNSWEWRAFSLLIANGTLFLLVFARLSRVPFYRPNKMLIKKVLSYSLPLVPNALLAIAIGFSDKLFITNYLGLSANGVYSVAFQLGMIVALLQNSFNQAWAPWFFSEMKKETTNYTKIFQFSLAFVALFFIVCLGIGWLAPTALSYLKEDYHTPNAVVWLIMLAFFFNGVYKVFVNYLFYYRQTKLILFITSTSAILNIGLNAYLVPTQGMIGAAMATALAFGIQMVLTMSIVQFTYRLNWLKAFRSLAERDSR